MKIVKKYDRVIDLSAQGAGVSAADIEKIAGDEKPD